MEATTTMPSHTVATHATTIQPMNKKQSALAAGVFIGLYTVCSTVGFAKLVFNTVRAAGGLAGASAGALVGTVGGGIYKGVQALRHKQTKPLSDYAIKAAQTGYRGGSLVGAGVAIGGAVAGAPYAAVVMLGYAAGSAINGAIYSPFVGVEHHRDGYSETGKELLKSCDQPNRFIKRMENRFLNWRKDDSSEKSVSASMQELISRGESEIEKNAQ